MSSTTTNKPSLLGLCGIAVAAAAMVLGATLSQDLISLKPAATSPGTYHISGTLVRSTDGKPVAGLTVKIFDESGDDQPLVAGTSNADGNYELAVEWSRLPQPLREHGELQKFVIRVFNEPGQVIKSPESNIEMTSDTNARVDFRLLPSEINLTRPFVCGYGQDDALSNLIVQLSGRELTEVFRSFNTRVEPSPQLNTNQQKLVDGLEDEAEANTCAEGFFSSSSSYLEKRGETHLVESLRQAMVVPLNKVFVTKNFRVLYTTKSKSAVNPWLPDSDSELRMPNGELVGYIRANVADLPGNDTVPPIQVQEVGLIAEFALKRFTEPPFNFRNPVSPGQELEILIEKLPAAGATDPDPRVRHILINNRNSRDQNFGTVPHELFHRVQYEYNRTAIRSGLYGVLREGGARFIEDSFNDEYNRYVFESRKIFFEPAYSLLTPADSCSTPINYAAALFWKYVAEQHAEDTSCKQEPFIGINSYRQVLESTSGSQPYDIVSLRKASSMMTRPASFDEFQYLDNTKTELETSETTWGNYLIANYVHSGDLSPIGERRYVYLEDQDFVTWPYLFWDRDEVPMDVRRLAKLGAVIKPYNDLKISSGGRVSRTVIGQLPYAATYYRIKLDSPSALRAFRVSLSAFGGLTDPLIQILSFDSNGVLSDIVRSDQIRYSRIINVKNLSSVVVIVATRMTGGDYTLRLDEIEGGPDPMITRWNSKTLTEYEIDPRNNAWEFKSVDLTVNTEQPLSGGVLMGVDNKLNVRVHNRGNVPVESFEIDLQYQPYRRRLDPTVWQPVRNASNVTQTISGTGLTAAGSPGASQSLEVAWAPTMTSSHGWCIKATIKAEGDANNDNNVTIGCFTESNASQSVKSSRR